MTQALTAENALSGDAAHTLDHCMARLFARWRKKADRALKAGAAVRSGLARAAVTGLLAVGLAGNPSQADASAAPDRPNVIHIMADDQEWWNLGCYGRRNVLTPNLDSLARGGVLFTNATPVCPLCAPARVSLLTGKYPSRFAPQINNTKANIPVNAPNIGRVMTNAGYRTAYVGKTHFSVSGSGISGTNVPANIAALGFEYTEMAHGYVSDSGCHFALFPKSVDSAKSFITRNKDNPFVALVYVTPTHGHHEAPQEYIDRVAAFNGDVVDAMTSWLDDKVGSIVRHVDSLGIRGKTMIIYSSDNSTTRIERTALGNKMSVYHEPVPFIVSWPGRFRAGLKITQIIQDIDLFPTILDVCGVPSPSGWAPDGRSILPLLEERAASIRTSAYYESGVARAVTRDDGFKYIAVRQIAGLNLDISTTLADYGGSPDVIFNLVTDSVEKVNLVSDPAYADTLAALKALFSSYMSTFQYCFGEFPCNTEIEKALPKYFTGGAAGFSIYDLRGRLVGRFQTESGKKMALPAGLVRGLPNGIYFWRAITAGGTFHGKHAVVR